MSGDIEAHGAVSFGLALRTKTFQMACQMAAIWWGFFHQIPQRACGNVLSKNLQFPVVSTFGVSFGRKMEFGVAIWCLKKKRFGMPFGV